MPDITNVLNSPQGQTFKVPTAPALPSAPAPQPTQYLEPNYADHYNAWKAQPGPGTTDKLLGAVDPILREALRIYGSSQGDSPTLRSKAKMLAIDAFGSYDPTRAKLRTHLLSQLQGLRRMAAKEQQIISVPEQVLLDQGHLREAENKLRDQLGRDPSDWELADHTGLSPKRLAYLRTMKPTFSEGKLTRVDEEGSSMSTPAVEAGPSKEGNNAWLDFVYADLHPTDQLIMEHTLGLHGKKVLSNQEVARKLGLSPGAISQRKARIQSMLDRRDDTGLL